MRKYKVKKEYPGGAVMNDIISYTGNGWRSEISGFAFFDDPSLYPEYWEDITIRSYEILEYVSKDKIIAPATNFAVEISKPGHWNINSVKRLEDGEVFTIGDIIDRSDGRYKNDKIRAIYISKEDENLLVSTNDRVDKTYHGGKGCNLSIISHHKEVLFTTKDKVDICLGDDYWVFDSTMFKVYPVGRATCTHTGDGVNRTYFSTKEKAEEEKILYQEKELLNIECLSINEILSIAYNPVESRTSTTNKLVKLILEKRK